jgi:hypothetical protein
MCAASLIYIDPPFWTNENYYAKFEIADKEITKLPSVIERLAYKDIWEGGFFLICFILDYN